MSGQIKIKPADQSQPLTVTAPQEKKSTLPLTFHLLPGSSVVQLSTSPLAVQFSIPATEAEKNRLMRKHFRTVEGDLKPIYEKAIDQELIKQGTSLAIKRTFFGKVARDRINTLKSWYLKYDVNIVMEGAAPSQLKKICGLFTASADFAKDLRSVLSSGFRFKFGLKDRVKIGSCAVLTSSDPFICFTLFQKFRKKLEEREINQADLYQAVDERLSSYASAIEEAAGVVGEEAYTDVENELVLSNPKFAQEFADVVKVFEKDKGTKALQTYFLNI